jgi:hypothetical protein
VFEPTLQFRGPGPPALQLPNFRNRPTPRSPAHLFPCQKSLCLRLRNSFCYICKVLVGLRTPYLGLDIQTATPLVARETRDAVRGLLDPDRTVAGCIESAPWRARIINFIG